MDYFSQPPMFALTAHDTVFILLNRTISTLQSKPLWLHQVPASGKCSSAIMQVFLVKCSSAIMQVFLVKCSSAIMQVFLVKCSSVIMQVFLLGQLFRGWG